MACCVTSAPYRDRFLDLDSHAELGLETRCDEDAGDLASQGQTERMSQYNVVPKANGSALNIGVMAKDSFFAGSDRQYSD